MGAWVISEADGAAILEAVAAAEPLLLPRVPRNEAPMETVKRFFWPGLASCLAVVLVGLFVLDRAWPNPPAPAPVPAVDLPDRLEARAFRLIALESAGRLTVDDWIVEGAIEEIHRDGHRIKLFAQAPGEASVYALAVDGRRVAWDVCRIKVVGPEPPVPPGPTPPSPPGPTPPAPPVPPVPIDTFARALGDAYAADPAADKATKLQALATFYGLAAPAMADDRDYRTAQELVLVLHEAVNLRIGAKSLAGVREAIRKELNARVKAPSNAPLDEALRATYRSEFTRVAKYLTEVK